MTADWMVFAVAVGVALTLAALAAEHAGRMVRWPGRFVWISSIVATTVWPGAAYLAARGSTPAVSGAATAGLPFSIDVARMVPPPSAAALGPWRALNAVLLAAWVLWSGFLLIRMAATMARIARQRSGWRHDTVDGEPVRVSTDLGPAVVGVVRPEIVLPAWTLSLDAPFRTLMLRHEVEHREAGDPRLLFLAATCLVLAPWNLALWYQTRRLRLAVEMDCDQRVLARHTEHDRYGRLLITIAQQQSNLPVALAPTLSEPVTHLERRIRAMMSAPKPFARLRAVGLVLAGVAAVVAACAVHTPDQVTGPEQSPAKRAAMAADSNQTYFAFQVDRQVTPTVADAPTYPALLRSAKVTGEVLAQFVVTTDGRANMSTFKILKSSHELFTQAVQNWLSGQTFTPAEIRGHAVRQLVQQQFVFQLSDVPDSNALPPMAPTTVRPSSTAQTAPASSAAQYFSFKVAPAAHMLPGNTRPQYPALLASAKVEGEVVVQFVVDPVGRVDTSSVRIVKTNHQLFANAVKEVAPEWKFAAAMADGHTVKQLVQVRVYFSLVPSAHLPPGSIEVTPTAK